MDRLAASNDWIDLNSDRPTQSLTQLKELGIRQGLVTYDDVRHLFPEVEQDVDFLDQIYGDIREAGILFAEEDTPADDIGYESKDKIRPEPKSGFYKDHSQSNIEPDNLIGLYFQEAAACPLLTHQEEVELAKRIERGLLARNEITDSKIKSAIRRKELLFFIEDSWNAIDHLIIANSRLVISIAKKYAHRGLPILDLIQEGNIGLMRAAKRFDYKRGYKFSTYATWWIRQAVTRALADQSRTIRLPVHRNDQLMRMFRMQHQLKQQLGRDPGTAEIAEALGVSLEKIQEMSKDAQHPLSLDMPVSVDSESVLGDFIEDQESPDPDEAASLNLLRQHLDQILELLPPREVQILKLRFGLANGEIHTLQEVGLKMGVSRERIRQIEAQAMSRLRQPEIQYKLRNYLTQHY